MTDLLPAEAVLATWSGPLDQMAPADVRIRAQALLNLSEVAHGGDPEKRPAVLADMLDGLTCSDPIYVELRHEFSKHQKLPADALPRWPMNEWD